MRSIEWVTSVLVQTRAGGIKRETEKGFTSGPPLVPLSKRKVPPAEGMKMGCAFVPLPPPKEAEYPPLLRGIDFAPSGPVIVTAAPASSEVKVYEISEVPLFKV